MMKGKGMWEKIKKNRTLHLCILLTGCALLFGAPALAADMVEGTTGNSVDKKKSDLLGIPRPGHRLRGLWHRLAAAFPSGKRRPQGGIGPDLPGVDG